MEAFDLQRIFIGDVTPLFLLEIAARTTILYLYTLLVLRLIGQRGMERLSSFDFAIVIALGSAVGDPMFYPEVPLLHGITVVTTILIIERAIGQITKRSAKTEAVIEGRTQIVAEHGRLNLDFLRESTLSKQEIFMKLRHQGARTLGQVEAAYLELDGGFSVFLYRPGGELQGLPLMPPWDVIPRHSLGGQDKAPRGATYACTHCGEMQNVEEGIPFPPCPRCHENRWIEAE